MDFGSMDSGEIEQQRQSPVDVILGIRKELAEFQKAGGRQALLATLREAREDDLRRAAAGCPDCPDSEPLVVEYLEQRGLIRLSSRRTKKNGSPSAGETASRPKRRLFGV